MNNIIDKAVSVDLGKAVVALKFDWNAISALEEATGKSMPASLADLKDKPFATSRLFVWAGVQHQMAASLNDIGLLMEFDKTKDIADAVMQAIDAQFGSPGNAPAAVTDPNAQPTAING